MGRVAVVAAAASQPQPRSLAAAVIEIVFGPRPSASPRPTSARPLLVKPRAADSRSRAAAAAAAAALQPCSAHARRTLCSSVHARCPGYRASCSIQLSAQRIHNVHAHVACLCALCIGCLSLLPSVPRYVPRAVICPSRRVSRAVSFAVTCLPRSVSPAPPPACCVPLAQGRAGFVPPPTACYEYISDGVHAGLRRGGCPFLGRQGRARARTAGTA